MAQALVVVDSAVKGESIKELLGDRVEVLLLAAAPVKAGFVPPRESLRRDAPHFDFLPLPEEKDFLDALFAYQGEDICLAFDSDWRGEFWAWLIDGYWDQIASQPGRLKRLLIHGVAREILERDFRLMSPAGGARGFAVCVTMLFDSALSRHLDRLLGTRLGPGGLPLNILSLSTLFLLAERETEIHLYTPSPKWKVSVRLTNQVGECVARLQEAYGISDDGLFKNEKELRTAIKLFDRKDFSVQAIERTPLSLSPPSPPDLAGLLHDAVLLGGLKPIEAMNAIRRLYYGVKIDSRRQGLISAFLPFPDPDFSPIWAAVDAEIGRRFGKDRLAASEDAGEGGEWAILPIRPELGPDELSGTLNPEEECVYRLIWSRALASRMREARGESLSVQLAAGEGCLFSCSGLEIQDMGFFEVYRQYRDTEIPAPFSLAGAKPGDRLICQRIMPEKSVGMPPEYYGFSGLASDLADFSIACDPTLVAMLQQMLDLDYLRQMPDGTFRCAENALSLIRVMNRAFPSMKGVNFSAYLSQTVEEAVSGRKSLAFALQQFEQTMVMRGEILKKIAVPLSVRKRGISSKSVIRLQESAPVAPLHPASSVDDMTAAPTEATEGGPEEAIPLVALQEQAVCETETETETETEVSPQQEEEMPAADEEQGTIPDGVSSFEVQEVQEEPEAVISPDLLAQVERMFAEIPAEADEEAKGEARLPEPALESAAAGQGSLSLPGRDCPDCGRPLLLKEDRFGKYWQCSGHPECRHAESADSSHEERENLLCPLCRAGNLVTKRTPADKIFYVCPEQDCEFIAWARPHSIPCPLCASPYLVEKKGAGGEMDLRCPRAGCGYRKHLGGDAPVGETGEGSGPKKKVLVRRVVKGSGGGGTVKKVVRVVRKK